MLACVLRIIGECEGGGGILPNEHELQKARNTLEDGRNSPRPGILHLESAISYTRGDDGANEPRRVEK